MKISGAIFDLDGTLLNSMYLWETIAADYLIYRGITPEPDVYERVKNMSLAEAADYYREVYGIDETVQTIRAGINKIVERQYATEVLPKVGVIEMLEKFRAGGIKMCIATATDLPLVESALKRNGMLDFFSGILTCSMVGASKKYPLIYEKALELLGTLKDETYIFEDALYAIETAKAAGFKVIGIEDDSAADEREEIIALSDEYIVSYCDWNGDSV